jgi:hypothetical protein
MSCSSSHFLIDSIAPLSVVGAGCGRWKTRISPNRKTLDARAFGFGNFRAQTLEKRLDVAPSNVAPKQVRRKSFRAFSDACFY